jgi:hypothetical protein
VDDIISVTIDTEKFVADLNPAAPRTVAVFRNMLPFTGQLVHVRWSGEAIWLPMGEKTRYPLDAECATRHPLPGELIFFPGGQSEAEMLLAYGSCAFGSKAGPLYGNHVLTLRHKGDQLRELGRRALWNGALPVRFEAAA